jgi:membrane protein DedA with SNARE-associated domain
MPIRRFLRITAASVTIWATINALEYYWFGRALAAADTWLQIALVCVGLAWLAISLTLLRRRLLRRLEPDAVIEDAGRT